MHIVRSVEDGDVLHMQLTLAWIVRRPGNEAGATGLGMRLGLQAWE